MLNWKRDGSTHQGALSRSFLESPHPTDPLGKRPPKMMAPGAKDLLTQWVQKPTPFPIWGSCRGPRVTVGPAEASGAMTSWVLHPSAQPCPLPFLTLSGYVSQ